MKEMLIGKLFFLQVTGAPLEDLWIWMAEAEIARSASTTKDKDLYIVFNIINFNTFAGIYLINHRIL